MNRLRCSELAGWLLTIGLIPLTPAAAQPATTAPAAMATVRFTYDNPGLQPARYTITVREDGSGHYRSERGKAPDTSRFSPQAQDRAIHVSDPVRKEIFEAARRAKRFHIHCENGGKKIAFQGTKTLGYTGPDGSGSCTYNWSANKQIERLTSIFEGISFTLVEGGKLKLENSYFKLSLDREMQTLVESAHEGDALEIENIDPVLEQIANDGRNLDRVRRDARELLSQSSSHKEPPGTDN